MFKRIVIQGSYYFSKYILKNLKTFCLEKNAYLFWIIKIPRQFYCRGKYEKIVGCFGKSLGSCQVLRQVSMTVSSVRLPQIYESVWLLCSFSHYQDVLFLILASNISMINISMILCWHIKLLNVWFLIFMDNAEYVLLFTYKLFQLLSSHSVCSSSLA